MSLDDKGSPPREEVREAEMKRWQAVRNAYRNHLANLSLTVHPHPTMSEIHNIRRRDRLGGLIQEYQQVA